ncbi:GNAT family N-acetyltransferase [Paenibacillus sp. JTLBN-2024]
MDQFIGEPDYWNRGIGTMLIRAMAKYLLGEMKADRIVMDLQTWNTRASRLREMRVRAEKPLPGMNGMEGAYRDCWLIELDGRNEKQLHSEGCILGLQSRQTMVRPFCRFRRTGGKELEGSAAKWHETGHAERNLVGKLSFGRQKEVRWVWIARHG